MEFACAFSRKSESQSQHIEAQENIMKQRSESPTSRKTEGQSFILRRNKIGKLSQKMVEEVLLPQKEKRDVAPYMKNYPNYCLFYCLIGQVLEDCRGFKSWLHKSIKFVLQNCQKNNLSCQVHAIL